ncbi:MAG: FAD-linked oxidase C-terminal domain-containing protein, partial [Mariprofundaceae bacterium]
VTIAGNSDARNIVEETVAGNVKWNGESAQSTMKYRVGLYDANISLPKSQLKSFLKSVSNLDKLIHWSLPDSGVCRLSIDNAEQLTKITDLVESSGGFMEVEHQPADSDLPHWPIAPPGLAWMRKIKSALDPHGIFAPDILGEGL